MSERNEMGCGEFASVSAELALGVLGPRPAESAGVPLYQAPGFTVAERWTRFGAP